MTAPPSQQAHKTKRSELEAAAKAFVGAYFAHWSESNSDALRYFETAYAGTINFDGHPVPRQLLMAEKRKYAAHWPERIYTTRPSTIKATCTESTSECTITGQVEWDCRDIDGGQRSVGLANFTLQIRMSAQQEVKVTGEWSSVIARRQ